VGDKELKITGVSLEAWQKIIAVGILLVFFALVWIGLNLNNVVYLLEIREGLR
jgi:hypothetical protein